MSEWKYPGHIIYSYYKPRGGWYPSRGGGWTRGNCSIKVYLDEDEAFINCPKDCRVIMVHIEFENLGYLSSTHIAEIKARIVTEAKVLSYFEAFPDRNINYAELCHSLSAIDETVIIALNSLIEKKKLRLVRDDRKGFIRLFICRLAEESYL